MEFPQVQADEENIPQSAFSGLQLSQHRKPQLGMEA
jgi:hypothetical protein